MKAESSIVRIFPVGEIDDDPKGRIPEGGGVLVDERHALTCAHVLGEAGEGDVVWLDFSHVDGKPAFSATVAKRDGEADLALLEIPPDRALPEAAVPARFMGADEDAFRREVHICGFPKDRHFGDWIRGEFVGETGEGWLQMDHALTSKLVKPGFSGAPAWVDGKSRAAGLVVQRFWKEGESSAYVVPVRDLLKFFSGLKIVPDTTPFFRPLSFNSMPKNKIIFIFMAIIFVWVFKMELIKKVNLSKKDVNVERSFVDKFALIRLKNNRDSYVNHRKYYEDLILKLSDLGAKVIVFDFAFEASSKYDKGIRTAISDVNSDGTSVIMGYRRANLGVPLFSESLYGKYTSIGHICLNYKCIENIIRVPFFSEYYPTLQALSASAAKAFLGIEDDFSIDQKKLFLMSQNFDKKNGGTERSCQVFQYADKLFVFEFTPINKDIFLRKEFNLLIEDVLNFKKGGIGLFKGKIVFVGAESEDELFPKEPCGNKYYGVFLHMLATDRLISVLGQSTQN